MARTMAASEKMLYIIVIDTFTRAFWASGVLKKVNLKSVLVIVPRAFTRSTFTQQNITVDARSLNRSARNRCPWFSMACGAH